MKFLPTRIPDVIVIEPKVFGDHRGFFMETWQQQVFTEAGISHPFVQDNHSRSSQGILRGLHYQIKHPQGKLVRVISGEVFDVAVDIRKNSPTFGQWVGETLSADNRKMLWVPPGFAHGFYVMSESAEFLYKCTDFYTPPHERTILWNDPALGINWPLVNGAAPVLSTKDAEGVLFTEAEIYD
ncbi:MAG: dTDP-4-dehydrorhamnose 3,5-epimerase [Proteobacteria bacterium]|nr:dTDP-4-dehydrorhamnose 3,5-epimerase [Desulfobulbaceae bacterium]MBU4151265.1 dTDP-4-dehydrorhamnose 3,5-epimerase [Pseudomonadota bacterium]